jgi:hypothetical protein
VSNSYLQAVAPLKLPSTRKFVLMVLADMANDDGVSYASIANLIERTCLAERAVQMGLAYLEDLGILDRDFRRGRSTHYRLTDPTTWKAVPSALIPAQDAPPQDVHPRTTCTDTPAPGAPAPAPGAPAPAPGAPITITQPSLNPKSEPKKKRAKKPRAQVVIPDAPDWLDPKAWAEWVEYRSKLRGFTARALELSLKTIDRHRQSGHDPVRLIELAIERGWTGIYASDSTIADGQAATSGTGRTRWTEGGRKPDTSTTASVTPRRREFGTAGSLQSDQERIAELKARLDRANSVAERAELKGQIGDLRDMLPQSASTSAPVQHPRRPSVSDSFEHKTYTGTPDDELPDFLRPNCAD